MTMKNIPLLYLSIVVLSVTYPASPMPVLDGLAPAFEPPRTFLVEKNINNDVAATALPITGVTPNEPIPTQVVSDKLAHMNEPQPVAAPAASSPQTTQALEDDLTIATETPNSTDDKDDIVIQSGDLPVSIPAPLPEFHPSSLAPPAPTELALAPTEVPGSAVTELPTTVLTVAPTFRSTAIPGEFYSLSSNRFATSTSYRLAPSSTKPSVPLPSQGPSSESEITKQSRRTAVVGSIVGVGLVMTLVAFIFCFRCQCCRRKKSAKPLDLLGDDPERESLSAEDKSKLSDFSSPTLGLPVLRSHAPHTVTFAEPPDQHEWRVVAATHDGHVEDYTHVISGDSFMDIDLNSQTNLYIAEEDITTAASNARASAGGASTGARSYSTRASTYSSSSIDQSGQLVRTSGSFDKLNQLASLASTSTPSGPRTRKRSKTETSTSPPAIGRMKPTKSLPSITSYENRFSNDSARRTTCSGDSEWDVAQAYGARYSKESAAAGSILSTISEATMESVEAVEVGGKQCVLMKGKF